LGKKDTNLRQRYEMGGIFLVAAGIISLISLYWGNTGAIGVYIAKLLTYAFGLGAVVIPILMIVIGGLYIRSASAIVYSIRFWGLLLVYVSVLALLHHFLIPEGREILPESLPKGGGLAGGMTLFILRKFLGYYGAFVMLLALTLCGILIVTTWSLYHTLVTAKEKTQEGLSSAYEVIGRAGKFYNQEKDRRFALAKQAEVAATLEKDTITPARSTLFSGLFRNSQLPEKREEFQEVTEDKAKSPVEEVAREVIEKALPINGKNQAKREKVQSGESMIPEITQVSGYTLPPLSILKKAERSNDGKQAKEVAHNAKVLEETLQSFNVKARISHISQGPTVTRYEVEPAPGIKVSRIVNLADDIALSLAASGVRIEAPIPGKAAVGIEVPNKAVSSVPLREVLENNEFLQASSKLVVSLGKDIAGQVVTADLGKMPHLLVAGSTGSGKSVCVNTLLTSILFRATPEEVKFILIDPKVVELTSYNGLPHLLTPVVTDAKKAAAALRWAVQEMERRYELFAAAGVRDIGRYNEQIDKFLKGEGSSGDKIPYILVVIDELADLMMVSPVDVEDAIIRLAQKARAAGIHMVLATQRPSVDVITGLIKANVPSRISFAVSSQIDSRTILDMAGAEKLLGKGDMLFYPIGAPKPIRVQGAFIADSEVEELTGYIKKQVEVPEYVEGITTCDEKAKEQEQQPLFADELMEEAVRIIMETGQASASMLQRKFRIGYTRAARLIDTMEEMKILGPNMGSKPRDILMTFDQVWDRYFSNQSPTKPTETEEV
jgi:S-DNA-T family DNA segregation ATPase FtsK/SpoIIIE